MSKLVNKIQRNAEWMRKMEAENQKLYMEAMGGGVDPMQLIKAQNLITDINKVKTGNNSGGPKAMVMDPLEFSTSVGYKYKRSDLSYNLLRAMAKTPIIHSVISTRVDQVASFAEPQANKYELGFVIRQRGSASTGADSKVTNEIDATIKEITDFILNCGDEDTNWSDEDFESWLRKSTWDSLVLDQDCSEIVYNRGGKPTSFYAVDAGTIRMANPKGGSGTRTPALYGKEGKGESGMGVTGGMINGHLPTHVQVIDERIMAEWYPWEMTFGIRNKSTDIRLNGYGMSELEILINIVTWMLYADKYNGNFFTNGSAPKGILKFGEGYDKQEMMSFRQEWAAMIAGVQGAWKIPMLGGDVDWVDLQKNNTDMAFSSWQEYLIRIACACYKMSPEEIGFVINSSTGSSRPLFEGSAESRLKYSRDKGLRPLLRKKERTLNRYIINPRWPGYEIKFVGLGVESEKEEIEIDEKKSKMFMTIDELRIKYGLPPLGEDNGGGVIANPNYIQWLGQQMEGQMGGNPESDDFINGLLGENGSTTDTQSKTSTAKSFKNFYLR
jgi:hypothetical protein